MTLQALSYNYQLLDLVLLVTDIVWRFPSHSHPRYNLRNRPHTKYIKYGKIYIFEIILIIVLLVFNVVRRFKLILPCACEFSFIICCDGGPLLFFRCLSISAFHSTSFVRLLKDGIFLADRGHGYSLLSFHCFVRIWGSKIIFKILLSLLFRHGEETSQEIWMAAIEGLLMRLMSL